MEIGNPVRVIEAPAPVDIPLPQEEPITTEPIKEPATPELEPVPEKVPVPA